MDGKSFTTTTSFIEENFLLEKGWNKTGAILSFKFKRL